MVELNPRYKTLFTGYKLNHPRNVAMVHPTLFLLRRIIFTACILSLDKADMAGIILFHCCTFVMLTYSILEH